MNLRLKAAALAACVAASLLTVLGVSPSSAVGEDSGGVFVPVTPFRAGTDAVPGGGTVTYQVAGIGSVPTSGVSAVAVTISATSTDTTASSYLTAYPSTEARPSVSTLVYTKENSPPPPASSAVVKVGSTGKITVYNKYGNTRLYLDVQGYFTTSSDSTASGGFVPIDPTRIARSDIGEGITQGPIAVGSDRDVQVSGVAGIPADATSVYANVIVDGGTSPGAMNLGPGGSNLTTGPAALRYGDNGVYSAASAVKLSTDGKMRIRNTVGNAVNVKVDVQGYFSGDPTAGGSFTALNQGSVYSSSAPSESAIAGGETREVLVAGVAGVPEDGSAGSVALVVTTKNWSSGGSLTVWNGDRATRPVPPTANWVGTSGEPSNGITSSCIVELSANGTVNITNTSADPVHVQVATSGWFSLTPEAQAQVAGVRSAMTRVALGTGTSADQALVESAGVADDIPDTTQPLQVEAADEDDVASSEDVAETTDGDSVAEPGADCSSGSDGQCVSGTTTGDSPDPEVSTLAVVKNCSAGERPRRYTVQLKQKAVVSGRTIFKWAHRIHYCTKKGKVTRWRGRYDYLAASSLGVKFRGLTLNQYRAAGAASAWSLRQRHIEYCLVKFGCYLDLYPWTKLTVTGNGGKSYKGKIV